MRFPLRGLVALSLTIGSAFAADLPPRKADLYVPPPPPPALPFYIGAFGGGAFGDTETTFGGKNLFCYDGAVSGPCSQGGGGGRGGKLGSQSGGGGSPFGGLRIGADFAVSQSLFLGGVADIALLNRSSRSRYEYTNFSEPGIFGEDRGVLASSLKTNWIATLRAKLGIAMSDRVLLFGTGGLALVDVGASVRNEYDVVDGIPPASVLNGGAVVQQGSTSGVALGYALGGGVGYRFMPHLGVSLEYVFYSASKSYTVTQTSGATLAEPSFRAKAKPSGHLVRIGLDYHL